jgi:hypothetical protein
MRAAIKLQKNLQLSKSVQLKSQAQESGAVADRDDAIEDIPVPVPSSLLQYCWV